MKDYFAISAVRNEEAFIASMINSVLNQNLPPKAFVLVDDGSTDKTSEIAKAFDVDVVRISSPRFSLRGINQVHALRRGIKHLNEKYPSWEYLLKLDGDSELPSTYALNLVSMMQKFPDLGICGGEPQNESYRLKRVTDGARLYRRECWEQIKGLDYWNAFDSHALLKARQWGWQTRTFPKLKYCSLRGSTKLSMSRWIVSGFARGSFGLPLYHTAVAAFKNIKTGYPPIFGPLAMILSHAIDPWDESPNLDKKWVKRYAIYEIMEFAKDLVRGN